MTSTRHIVLVGLMGTGKSTVGRRLAKRLGLDFVDTDAEIERETGRSIRGIFSRDGEEAFRRIERDVVDRVLSARKRQVVAAGGGVVIDPSTRAALQHHVTIWLVAKPENLAGRIRRGAGHRPLVDDDPIGKLTTMANERRSMYEEASSHQIVVDGSTPEAVLEACVLIVESS